MKEENPPDKTLYYNGESPKSSEIALKYQDKLSEYVRNSSKSLGALQSIISEEIRERFKDKGEASELWDAITKTFGETSLEVVGRFFDRLITANYSECKSMDEYTALIQSFFNQLNTLNQNNTKLIMVWILFKGLNEAFGSFVSRR